MENFITEVANPIDASILTTIAFESKASLGYEDWIIEKWRSELVVTSEMVQKFISYVIKLDGKIIAFWCREPVEVLSDGRLFVLPAYQRRGCGRLLWQAVLSEGRKRGLKRLIWEADYKVLPFYLKMGATLLGEKNSTVVDGLKLPIIGVEL
jgi:GNAT superfamily N-acetyltransferase